MWFFVYFLVPETKGISLEKMDELFGVTDAGGKVIDDQEKQPEAAHDEITEKK
jgi:hypothetical protein